MCASVQGGRSMAGQQDSTTQSAFFNDNALKLGVFCLNVSGGMMLSGAAKPKLEWDENVSVAKVADQTGWEFLLPIGRWRGHGGKYNANAEQYECFTWAAAIAALTSRIHVFSTCHVPIFHPMLAAKLGATVDNISGGRWGLNIVSGWNAAEFGMFGIEQLSHDDRYLAAAEAPGHLGRHVARRAGLRYHASRLLLRWQRQLRPVRTRGATVPGRSRV